MLFLFLFLFIGNMHGNGVMDHALPDDANSFIPFTTYFTVLSGLIFTSISVNLFPHMTSEND